MQNGEPMIEAIEHQRKGSIPSTTRSRDEAIVHFREQRERGT